jgi:hypothetical protein
MIRTFQEGDLARTREIHVENGLPENCFPDIDDPLFIVKLAVEHDGKPVMVAALKGISELFLIVDHNAGTPAERWEWLQQLNEAMKARAWELGLDQLSCWIPPEIADSFEKRLIELGFTESKWRCFTCNLC